jgi:hypothetical protein
MVNDPGRGVPRARGKDQALRTGHRRHLAHATHPRYLATPARGRRRPAGGYARGPENRNRNTMSILRTVILFASAVLAVLCALAFGHGLSTHRAGAFLWSAGFLALSAVLIALQVRAGGQPTDRH